MELKIYATGRYFGKSADLGSTVELLDSYERAFTQCLKRACISNRVRADKAYLKIASVVPGSLDVALVTEVAAAISPLAPQIFGYAWDLYKSAFDLIAIATARFNEKGRPMNITISNSPGAAVNVVNGDQVNTTKDVLDVAAAIHPQLERIAKLIKSGKADRIQMGVSNATNQPLIDFNPENKSRFEMPEADAYEQEPIGIECEIFRFNKKTLLGTLEIEIDQKTRPVPFSVAPLLRDECIEAFKASRLNVLAHREMTLNALGESKIKKLHIIQIQPS
jgi:hypothetical protein